MTVTGRNSQLDFVTARAIATSSNINCPRGDTHVDNHLLSRPFSSGPLGLWDSGDIDSLAVAPPLVCQGSLADATAVASTRMIHDVQSVDGDLDVTYTATDLHSLTMSRTGTLIDNFASTAVLSLLAVRFDVVSDTVQLSCSTTLSGDPRDPLPQEVEDQVFELRHQQCRDRRGGGDPRGHDRGDDRHAASGDLRDRGREQDRAAPEQSDGRPVVQLRRRRRVPPHLLSFQG